MKSAKIPEDEIGRLTALHALEVLDTGPEQEFDALVKVASLVCGKPVSLISLVDAERQWFKANIGLPGATETARDIAFCAHAILANDVFVVNDASKDARFFDNPLVVGAPDVRFYAGAPIALSDGHRVGTLCVIDRLPGTLDARQIEILQSLALAASRALEGRRAAREQQRLAVALAKSKLLLDQTGALANVGAWELDLSTYTMTWSEESCRIHGVPSGFTPGLEQAIAFFVPEARAAIHAAVQAGISGGQNWDVEYPLIRTDGARIWVRMAGAAQTEQGRPVRLLGAYQDVSKSRASQDQLKLLENAMNAVSDIVLITEAEPFEQPGPRILYVNDAFERSTGYTRAEAIGQTPRMLQGPDTQRAELDRIYQALKGWSPVRAELVNYTKRGDPYWLEIDIQPIADATGWFTHWVAVERDISERKQAQAELSDARNTAIAANTAKSQFLANMSHEIRTPMNAVLGMLNLLSNTPLASKQFDYVDKAKGAAKALLGIVNDILDFSKIEAGKMELELRTFHLDHLLRELAVVLSANVSSKSIEVLYDVDPGIGEWLVGDAMRLRQVLINLAGNAIKFTQTGQVVVSLKLAAQDAGDGESLRIAFAVQDSGIGIAPEHQQKIFGGFSQAEASTSRRFGGTGLGLAISQRLVELMGGQLALSSTLGSGSTFCFTLNFPVANQSDDEADIPSDSTPAAQMAGAVTNQEPNRVLLIDDNPVACEIMGRMMRDFGWTVDIASGGEQALDLIASSAFEAEFPYQSVFIDWQMPHLNGWETLRRLQGLRHDKSAPAPKFIMLSDNGRDDLSHRTQAEQNQLNAFLVKPVTASMLLDASLQQSTDSETLRRTPRSSKRQLEGMRILVAEDNAINQQVAEELLSFEGALVSIVGDGQQALNAVAAASRMFDVVLMDVQMPVMDGLAATRAIREELGCRTLPIVGLTANAMASDRQDCLQAGMNDHVGKPFDMASLVSLLIRLTGFHPVAQPIEPAEDGEGAVGKAETEKSDIPPLVTPDIDLPAALRRLGGMQALYVRAAGDLQRTLDFLTSNLESLLQSADLHQAEQLLHSCKGNAGTLGLTRLFDLLGRLEKLCRDQSPITFIRQQAQPMTIVLRDAQAAMNQAVALLKDPGAPLRAPSALHGSKANALEYLRATIVPRLKANDLTVLEEFAKGKETLNALPADLLGRIEHALQGLDFDEAIKVCLALLE